MKLFEVTELLEKVSADQLKQIKAALKVYNDSKGSGNKNQPAGTGTAANKDAGKDGDLMKPIAGNMMPLEAVASQIKSGAAKLSKDIDAELGKRGADPSQVHGKIFNLTQEASREYAKAFNKANGITKKAAITNIKNAQITLRAAAYGYINKKYLGGSADNFSGNTKELIAQALQSQASKGGNQPVGKVSSARPTGQTGTVPSGQDTNALDAMADADF